MGPEWKDVKNIGDFFLTVLVRLIIILFAQPLAILFCCVNFYLDCKQVYPAHQRWQRHRQVRRRARAWTRELSDFCSRHCQGFICPRHHKFGYPQHVLEPLQFDQQTESKGEVKRNFGVFLRLLPELRERIYELAIEATMQLQEPGKSPSSWGTLKEEHALLFVSRQVREESMPLFYAASRFHVRIFEDQAATLKRNPGIVANSPPPYNYNPAAAPWIRDRNHLTIEELQKAIDGPRVSPWIYRLPARKFRRIHHMRLEFDMQLSWADHWPVAVFDLDYHRCWHVTRVPPTEFPWWCMESWRNEEMSYEYKWVSMVEKRISEVLIDVKSHRERDLELEDFMRMACISGELKAWKGREFHFGPGQHRLLRGLVR